jgi:hypothetical protein
MSRAGYLAYRCCAFCMRNTCTSAYRTAFPDLVTQGCNGLAAQYGHLTWNWISISVRKPLDRLGQQVGLSELVAALKSPLSQPMKAARPGVVKLT